MKTTLKSVLFSSTLILSTQIQANFNFGECSGSGTFEQQIHQFQNYEDAAIVGEIPSGIKGLKVSLTSDKDVDIRLYGKNEDKIVHWPYGILHKGTKETKPYQEINVTYSGYNGVGNEKGHEYIEVNGTTPVKLTMKAFGYRAGYATVNYSWTGKEGCSPSNTGNGNFTQTLLKNTTSLVGTIPPHVNNLEINLTSIADLDIQLYAQDGTAIASWKPTGLMSGSNKQNIIYHDMNITWSGYNGTNAHKGNEYITITGETSEMLIMKVFGYEAGEADVIYRWGDKVTPITIIDENFSINLEEIENYNPNDTIEDQYLTVINYLRSLHIKCNDKHALEGPVSPDLVWETLLTDSSQEHSNDMLITNNFAHNGSGQESDITGQTFNPVRASTPFERMHHHNYFYTRAGENIAYRAAYPILKSDAWVRAMEDWMKSHTGHCSNIMNPSFHDFGMVEARGTKPMVLSNGITRDVPIAYWTQNFGTRP